MESIHIVYLVGIFAVIVVILGVVWLLRNRITRGYVEGSATEKKVTAGLEAAPPSKKPAAAETSSTTLPPAEPPSVDISGNWLIGTNVIRVLRDRVRVARNWVFGQSRIEDEDTPPAAKKSKSRKRKK